MIRRNRLAILQVRGPESQVVSQKLHDKGGVLVRLLAQRIQFSDGIIEGLLGEVAGTVGRVEDLVVEDREVQGQTQSDRVGGGELNLSDIGGLLVSLMGGGSSILALITGGILGNVTVVVALPIG